MFRLFILLIIILLSGCTNNKIWDRYSEINSGSKPVNYKNNVGKLSDLHHKGSDNNFVYGPYKASIQP